MALHWLKYERESRSWSQEQLAEKLGTSQVNISRWENGSNSPNSFYQKKLSELFGKALHEITEEIIKDDNKQSRLSAFLDSDMESWGQILHIDQFYGRTTECSTLEDWIIRDHCRLVTIVGFAGIGKTSLASRVAEKIKNEFDYVFWYSLQYAPLPEKFLQDCLRFLSNHNTQFSKEVDRQISFLIKNLRAQRTLIVLDNFEAILQVGQKTGQYRKDYEEYGKFLQLLGEINHKSCILLTSRELPKEIAPLQGSKSPVRSWKLTGVGLEEGKGILKDKELSGSDQIWRTFIDLYSGNPLALKLVAPSIREVFDGSIAEFLKQKKVVFGEVRALLEDQFSRLSQSEKEIMYWLAIEQEAVSLDYLQEDLVDASSKKIILETLDSLRRRSMIETNSGASFTLLPSIKEQVIDALVKLMFEEIEAEEFEALNNYALIKAQAKDYVRNAQLRLILTPLKDLLVTAFGRTEVERKVKCILSTVRLLKYRSPGYAAGNLLNLLIDLGGDLRGYDFSYLTIWQAYLQEVELQDVKFAYANFSKTVFTDTFGSVFSLAFTPNGRLFVTGTVNGEIRLWETKSSVPLLTYEGHKQWVFALDIRANGDILASGSGDRTVRLWEVDTGQCLKVLMGHEGWVRSVAFAPDGKLLASGSEDKTIRLWDASTGQCLNVLQGHTKRVSSVAFAPDGKLLASGSEDKTIRLWDASTGQCLNVLQGHLNQVWSVAFSPDGKLLASGSEDKTIRLWDASTGQCLNVLQGHTKRVSSVAFAPNGGILASGSEDQTVCLWNTCGGDRRNTLRGHSSGVKAVSFSPDSNLLATGSEDQMIRLWDVKTGDCLKVLKGYSKRVSSVDFSPNGQVLSSGSEDKLVRLWKLSVDQGPQILQGHINRVRSVAFSKEGKIIASGSEDQTIRLWNVDTQQCVKILHGHTDAVRTVAFSPDGKLLASGGDDKTIRLWDIFKGQCLNILQGHTKRVRSVAFSPDGKLLASGSEDKTIRFWEVGTGQYLKELRGHTERVWSVAFSPDGKLLASGSEDKTIRFWEVGTGQYLKELRGHTERVWSVAFSPDGKLLASSSDDLTVCLWKVNENRIIDTLPDSSYNVRSIAFSPDGKVLALANNEGTIRLWDMERREYRKGLRGDGPYERMNIFKVGGLTEAQKDTLRVLGAVEWELE